MHRSKSTILLASSNGYSRGAKWKGSIYAKAMADAEIDLPEYGAEKGKLLTFTAAQAKKAGYSEGTVSDRAELYRILGVEDADIRSIEESFPEKLARFLTNPYVVPLLLTIAGIGIVIELFSPGYISWSTGVLALVFVLLWTSCSRDYWI